MNIRESLNKYPKASAAVAAVVVAAALVFIVRQLNAPEDGSEPITKAYFTTDDGKTRFADEATRLTPFVKDGKEAVRCYVYQAGRSPEFVAYLERLSPTAMKRIQESKTKTATASIDMQGISSEMIQEGIEVKKPGDAKWVSRRSSEGSEIINVKPPAGQTGELLMVSPRS